MLVLDVSEWGEVESVTIPIFPVFSGYGAPSGGLLYGMDSTGDGNGEGSGAVSFRGGACGYGGAEGCGDGEGASE